MKRDADGMAKGNGKTEGKLTKAAFVRTQPLESPVEDVVAAGLKEGYEIKPSDVHAARYYLKKSQSEEKGAAPVRTRKATADKAPSKVAAASKAPSKRAVTAPPAKTALRTRSVPTVPQVAALPVEVTGSLLDVITGGQIDDVYNSLPSLFAQLGIAQIRRELDKFEASLKK